MTQHDDPPAPSGATKHQRIAKLMARAGLCSRRDAEAWIVDGRVSVNGRVITSPALDVAPEDVILVDGAPIPTAEKTRLFLFHKPRGLVTSDHDPEGRMTVADFLREHWPDGPRVVTIGRLDINTEGLLLLTNDGGLARLLELPKTGWVRRYRVRAKGTPDPATLEALAAGVTIDGIDYAGIEAKLDRIQGANCWLTMGLREGKNREVKRVLEHIGLEVNRLIRLSFGPFQLLDIAEGTVEEVRTRVLRDQLGESLAALAMVDFGDSEPAKTPQRMERAPHDNARPPREGGRAVGPAAGGPRPAPDRATRPPLGSRGARPSSGDRPLRQRQDRRDDREDGPPPQRERPIAGTRKHVSTLRAVESEAVRTGPRKRIERSDTQDRRERTIKVERLVSTRAAPEKAPPRRPRAGVSDSSSSKSRARDPSKRLTRDEASRAAAPRGGRFDEKRSGPRSEPEGRGDRRRDDARPPRREDRPVRQEDRPVRQEDRLGARRGEGAAAPRRHASPSALGKRERMSRSGGAPDRDQERGARRGRGEGRAPAAGPKVRSNRPAEDSGRPLVRGERARFERARVERTQVGRPDPERRERRPTPDRKERSPDRGEPRDRPDKADGRRPDAVRKARPRPTGDRHEGRRDDKAPRPAGGRPMGAASRKPGGHKQRSESPQGPRAPNRSGPNRAGPPRGKPPRGPKR